MYKPGLGWIPDTPDVRDELYAYHGPKNKLALSAKYSTRNNWFDVWDQLNLGSCTANAGNGCLAYRMMREGKLTKSKANTPEGTPSRLQTYYDTRWLMGTTSYDSGASIRDTMKAMYKWFPCSEKYWKYDVANYRKQPPPWCYWLDMGKTFTYRRVSGDGTNRDMNKQAILTDDAPLVIGFTVYESFWNIGADGIMPFPNVKSEQVEGGHAVILMGWDDNLQALGHKGFWEVRNSWNSDWGDEGYFWMPYDFTDSGGFSDDCWLVDTTT